MMLQSSGWAMVGAMFTFGATARPSGLGVTDYGGGVKTLGLCPPKPNCVSTGTLSQSTAVAGAVT